MTGIWQKGSSKNLQIGNQILRQVTPAKLEVLQARKNYEINITKAAAER